MSLRNSFRYKLKNIVKCNKNIKIENKVRIYKATIRPIMRDCVETLPETAKINIY